jgi:hypothetical protein
MGQVSCCSRNISDQAFMPLRKTCPENQPAGMSDTTARPPNHQITEKPDRSVHREHDQDSPCLQKRIESPNVSPLHSKHQPSRSFRMVPVHKIQDRCKIECSIPATSSLRKQTRYPSMVVNRDQTSETRRNPAELQLLSSRNIIKASDGNPKATRPRVSISQFSFESVNKLNKIFHGSNLLSRFRSPSHQTNSLRMIPIRESFSPGKQQESAENFFRVKSSTYMKSQSQKKTYQGTMASPDLKKRRGKKINSQFSEIMPLFPELKRPAPLTMLCNSHPQKESEVLNLGAESPGMKKPLEIRTTTQLHRIDEMQGIAARRSQANQLLARTNPNSNLQPKTFSSFRVMPVNAGSLIDKANQGTRSKDSERHSSSLSGHEAEDLFFPNKNAEANLGGLSPMSQRDKGSAHQFNLKDCSLLERDDSESGSSKESSHNQHRSSKELALANYESMKTQRTESLACDKLAHQSTKEGLSSHPIIVTRRISNPIKAK